MPPPTHDSAGLLQTIGDLHAQLDKQRAHSTRAREREAKSSAELRQLAERVKKPEEVRQQQQHELDAVEEHIARVATSGGCAGHCSYRL